MVARGMCMVARDVCMVARRDMLMSILKVEALHVMTCYLSYSEVLFKARTLLVNIIILHIYMRIYNKPLKYLPSPNRTNQIRDLKHTSALVEVFCTLKLPSWLRLVLFALSSCINADSRLESYAVALAH